nr:MAG TPA: hypothetical protein [Caudoviricetes sp.]
MKRANGTKKHPQTPRKSVGGRGIKALPKKALPNSFFVAPGSKDLAKRRNINVFSAIGKNIANISVFWRFL